MNRFSKAIAGIRRVVLSLVVRRERWGLSWRGRLVVAGAGVLFGLACVRGIHPFLSVTSPVPAQVLVVEGWLPLGAVKEAAALFRDGHYTVVYTTGGLFQNGIDLEPADNYADRAAGWLKRVGVDATRVRSVPSEPVEYDRTYTSARTLRQWIEKAGFEARALNVVSLGPHSRRSWIMFQRAFGPEVQVGIIALPDSEYDPKRWWRYSEGVKEMLSECAAYVYAKLLFRPEKE